MKGFKLLLVAALSAGTAGALQAQQAAPPEPTISLQRAQTIALSSVAGNEGLKSAKLKTKSGMLVYEFDVETPGPGHQEVRVDAHTGAILSSEHEDDLAGATASKVTAAAHEAGHAVAGAAHDAGKAVTNTADRVLTGDELKNAHPRISEARARTIALRRFPTAKKVKDADLEMENGVLVWEVDVDTPGEGHEEVLVDANSGRILRTTHEVGLAGKMSKAVKKATR